MKRLFIDGTKSITAYGTVKVGGSLRDHISYSGGK